MQVICTSCGAQYDFDASVIPTEGYDAQCTTCNAIFFVSPPRADVSEEKDAAASELKKNDSEEISVFCASCKAEYRFFPGEIPKEGYDAQCTQCAEIFFVSLPTVGAKNTSEMPAPIAPPPHPLVEEATPVAPMAAEAARLASEAAAPVAQTLAPEVTVAESSGSTRPAAPPPPLERTDADVSSAPSPARQPPTPRLLPVEGSLTPDRAHELRQALAPPHRPSRRTRLSVALAWILVCVSVVALGVGWGLTVRAPDLRPAAKPQMPIQVIANAPTRQAASSLARGLKLLAPDTDAGYRNARAALMDAIARDPELVTDAYATAALIDILRGDDARREAHRGKIAPNPNELTQSFDALVSGATWLLRGRRVVCQTPLIAAVTAYWYAMSEARTSARTQIEHVAHLTDDPMHTDANRIVPLPVAELRSRAQALALAVAALADARLFESEPEAARRVPAALGRAEAAWPEWRRPRYELAAFLSRIGETDEARAVLERLLLDAPDHARAKLLLGQLPPKVLEKTVDPSTSSPKREGRTRSRKNRHANRKHRDRKTSASMKRDTL